MLNLFVFDNNGRICADNCFAVRTLSFLASQGKFSCRFFKQISWVNQSGVIKQKFATIVLQATKGANLAHK